MQKIREEINSIISAAKTAKQDALNEITQAEQALERAESTMQTASAAGDTEAYIRAKTTRDTAQEVLAMHRERYGKLTADAPLIDAERYNTLVFLILDQLATLDKQDKREVLALCDQIREIVQRNTATMNEGNDLLHKLQAEVYRFNDCPRNKRGEPVMYPGALKEYKDRGLSAWAGYAFDNCAQYSALVASVANE